MTDKTAEQFAEEILAKAKGKANGKTPPPHVDRGEGAALLDDVSAFLKRFIAYPSEHAHVAHVLWIAHTHLMAPWESTPRIAFLSPEPASGKSRALEATELVVPNPVQTVNVSPAYLIRKIGNDEGVTVLYDEIDTVFGPKAKENEDIRALLNAGHHRGAMVGRCVVHGKIVMTEEIPAFAPVALAGLGWLPDTILSRSIIVRMRRRAPNEKVEAFASGPLIAELLSCSRMTANERLRAGRYGSLIKRGRVDYADLATVERVERVEFAETQIDLALDGKPDRILTVSEKEVA